MIKKGDKNYEVTENKSQWTVHLSYGNLKVAYKISKKDCPTIEELKEFIEQNDVF